MRAKPHAKTSRIVAADGLTVTVAIAARPVDGAANAELLAVIGAALGVRKRDMRLALGGASKHKLLIVNGISEQEVAVRLARAAATGG